MDVERQSPTQWPLLTSRIDWERLQRTTTQLCMGDWWEERTIWCALTEWSSFRWFLGSCHRKPVCWSSLLPVTRPFVANFSLWGSRGNLKWLLEKTGFCNCDKHLPFSFPFHSGFWNEYFCFTAWIESSLTGWGNLLLEVETERDLSYSISNGKLRCLQVANVPQIAIIRQKIKHWTKFQKR